MSSGSSVALYTPFQQNMIDTLEWATERHSRLAPLQFCDVAQQIKDTQAVDEGYKSLVAMINSFAPCRFAPPSVELEVLFLLGSRKVYVVTCLRNNSFPDGVTKLCLDYWGNRLSVYGDDAILGSGIEGTMDYAMQQQDYGTYKPHRDFIDDRTPTGDANKPHRLEVVARAFPKFPPTVEFRLLALSANLKADHWKQLEAPAKTNAQTQTTTTSSS